jgi:transcriptional regulator with XRE-family HTH domain
MTESGTLATEIGPAASRTPSRAWRRRTSASVVNVGAMKAGPLTAAVGRHLQQLRLRAGIPIERLAKRVGLSASALQRIEERGAPLTIDMLSDLAGQLGTSVAEFVRQAKRSQSSAASRTSSEPELVGKAILDLPDGIDKLRVAAEAAVRLALELSRGNQSAAARLLGLERRALMRRLGRPTRKSRR